MGKKQETIINGIDVSECAYYNKDNEPYCCEIWDNECEAQNCYFKQLQRLKEENEELKKKKDEYYLRTLDYEAKISYLIQALEEIRNKLKKYDANIGDTIIANPIQDCYDTYKLTDEVLNDRD